MGYREIPYRDPLEYFINLFDECQNLYLLESGEGPRKLAEFSFIGFNPNKLIAVKNGTVEVQNGDERRADKCDNPLKPIRNTVMENRVHVGDRLVGGAVGYVSYDTVRRWEHLTGKPVDDLNFPDVEMGVYDDGLVFNHLEGRAYYYYRGECRFREVEKHLQKPLGNVENGLTFTEPKVNVDQEMFEENVKKAKHYIFNGDIFQVVISKRFEFNFQGDLIGFYRQLRRINPSPYMYFLKHGARQVVGSSPEMLARVENGVVETYPIAGTRPKLDNPYLNQVLAEELLSDEKERAEHIMLVDLARNDLGKVCDYGSIQVPEFMVVHQYSHVQHIVSKVTGRLSPQRDSFDVFKAVFPAGTVSGAPKVRAMEIIDELEPTRRGPYAGAVGYFSYNGDADFAITIRTLTADGDKAHIQVGAGIVADSNPTREWIETELKAMALIKALKLAEERS